MFANQVAKSGQKTLTSANLLQILSPALWLVTGGQNTGLSLAGEFVLDILNSKSSDRAPGKLFIWTEKVLRNKSKFLIKLFYFKSYSTQRDMMSDKGRLMNNIIYYCM